MLPLPVCCAILGRPRVFTILFPLINLVVKGSVPDPDSLNPDTGPAKQVNLDWIQGFDDQKLKKKIHQKKISFFDQKLQLTYP